ncbi:MAG: nuclear transport factor 2 family protein [Salaquimonas sp.]|nr:nuclear transport factor 2 family protein [Salaquimonas sp.]
MPDTIAVARACYLAYVERDRDAIERLIADDFHFTSPLDNRLDRESYFERCWPNSEVIENFDFIHLVGEGERVFVTYEGESVGGQRFRNTEILTMRNGQIVEAEVYFGWNLPHKAPLGGFVTEP